MAKSKNKTATKSAAKSATKKAPPKAAAKKSAAKKPAVKMSVSKAPAKTVAKSKPAKAMAAMKPASSAKVETVKMTKGTGLKRFNPLDDRIVIERVLTPEKTAGGLYIPDMAQEKPTLGKVVAVGRGHRDAKGRTRPCDVKVGDRVLFTAWSGAEIEVDGQKYVIMRETDLLGVTTA